MLLELATLLVEVIESCRAQPGSSYTRQDGTVARYDKWVLVIPPELVEALDWKEGLELTATRRGDGLTLRPEDTTD